MTSADQLGSDSSTLERICPMSVASSISEAVLPGVNYVDGHVGGSLTPPVRTPNQRLSTDLVLG